jgi:hypothetical protein
MLQATAISALTLIASIISVYSTKGLARVISYQHLLETGDQATRGAIMAFLLCVLFPECYSHLGLTTSLVGVGLFLSALHGFDLLYKNICNKSLLKSSPWYLYGLLLPHCCMEGFAISPYLNEISLNLSLLGFFLLHKISELAMVSLSTEAHNMTDKEKNSLLIAFIVITPLCMMTGVFAQSYLDQYPIIHDTALLISTAIFLHLALFCQFCSCEHKKNKSILQIKPTFLITCIVIAGLLSLAGAGNVDHHHHHHHGHEHMH